MRKGEIRQEIEKSLAELIGKETIQTGLPGPLIDEIVPDSEEWIPPFNLETLNRLLLYYNLDPVTKGFFDRFFEGKIENLKGFTDGIRKIRKASMLLFGNFKYGFKKLGAEENIQELLDRHLVEPLKRSGRGSKEIKDIPEEWVKYLLHRERETEKIFAASGEIKEDIKQAQEWGIENATTYLALAKDLDVYVAVTMKLEQDGDDTELRKAYKFMKSVFEKPPIDGLNLCYFNPLKFYLGSPADRGLMECLLLKNAKVMLYLAGKDDSFGKNAELATMLVQGKPVIVYVPEGAEFEDRVKLFIDYHPLNFQVKLDTGVAYGVIVVRNDKECRDVIYNIFEDPFSLFLRKTGIEREEEGNYYLCLQLENHVNKSRIRVITKDLYLTKAFWAFYF